jgi:negative regulator of flagellin synthesis FlgM
VPNKISGYTPSNPLPSGKVSGGSAAPADKTAGQTASPTAGSASTADQATFTGPARTLQKLAETLANTPVVNAAKVTSVKQSLQNGTYQVDNGRVADKLIEFDNNN